MTVVGFGSFRGDADDCAGACLGCEMVARQASSPRADRRRCRRRGDVGLSPFPAAAQTPTASAQTPAAGQAPTPTAVAANSTSDLLQPSLQGNPATPPRFRRPGQPLPAATEPPPTNKFTAPTRIGATPIYGSPNGFGAGNTGFDSLNIPRSKRKKPVQTPAPGAVVPQQPETTFTPVPTFNPAAPPKLLPPAEAAAARDLSEESGDAARRDLAAAARRIAGQQSAAGSASASGSQPARRRPAGAAAGILRLRRPQLIGDHAAADAAAAEHVCSGTAAAAVAADPGRARSVRGARHSRRVVPAAAVARSVGAPTAPIPNTCPAVRQRLMRSPRRS